MDSLSFREAPIPPPLPPPLPLPFPAPTLGPETGRKPKYKSPQRQLTEFWDEFNHKAPGKVTTILPRGLYKSLIRSHHGTNNPTVRNAATSYEVVAQACREKVASIVRHCRTTNEKFIDPDFDIYKDPSDCLGSLMSFYEQWEWEASWNATDDESEDASLYGGRAKAKMANQKKSETPKKENGEEEVEEAGQKRMSGKKNGATSKPRHREKGLSWGPGLYYGSIHRVDWIFEKPQFTVDGYSASDIRQGRLGNCWWLAAVATIAHRKDLMDKVMVARDEECGVYGFVFHRDGEWIYTIIDDNLFLTESDFTSFGDRYDPTGKLAREYKKTKQTGSKALLHAKCEDENETWLPLLEKAYAKVHNDFSSLAGGWPGEGVEDMTGGVNSYLVTSSVLSRDRFWKELVNENGEFVFSLGLFATGWEDSRGGMATGHAYSLLKAVEVEGPDGEKVRLVQIRNPWGTRDSTGFGEWNGRWSDGSSEWTPYWLEKLNYKFGDDGVFWMTFEDMLSHYEALNRTRLFNSEWTVAQQWTSVNVSWVTGYLQRKFVVEVKNGGLCVIILSQLDERYWTGLEGEYIFELYFLVVKEGGEEEEFISRAHCNTEWDSRSINCEVYLEAGRYEVLPKVVAIKRHGGRDIVEVVKNMTDIRPKKLRQVGIQYDIAHARPGVLDEDELLDKEKAEKKKKEDEKKKKEEERKKKEKARKKETKEKEKAKKEKAKARHEKEKEKEKRAIERANERKAKRRVRRQLRLEAEAKAKAKKEAKREKARLKKEKERLKKEEAEAEANAAAVEKEGPPESENSGVIVKKEDVEEEVKLQTEQAMAPDSVESKTEEDKPETAQAKTAEEVAPPAEASSNTNEGETKAVDEKGDSGSELGEVAAEKEAKVEAKVEADEHKQEENEDSSSSDEGDNEDLNYETEPEVSSDQEYFSSDEELEFDSDSESDSESESEENPFEETVPTGWNPVIVIGLRCYSKDKDVMVTVVEPKDPEKVGAATLAIEAAATGGTGAGLV